MDFLTKLEKLSTKNNSLLCVGLDTDRVRLPKRTSQFEFNKRIIEATYNFVCCYKLQMAFYEAEGLEGIRDLKKTVQFLKKDFPDFPIISDSKRGDIDNSSQKYANELFDYFKFDATTVSPYLGLDSLQPFFKRKNKGVIVICRTSNPGAADIQDIIAGKDPLYVHVAKKIINWNKEYKNLLMVVGATWPEELARIRRLTPEMTFLVPGIGVQGGDLKKTLKAGLRKDKKGLIIHAARSIIYAKDPKDSAKTLRDGINKYR